MYPGRVGRRPRRLKASLDKVNPVPVPLFVQETPVSALAQVNWPFVSEYPDGSSRSLG